MSAPDTVETEAALPEDPRYRQALARIQELEGRLALYEPPSVVPPPAFAAFPPGTVLRLGGDLARWHDFEACFLRMSHHLPPGTQLVNGTGQWLAAAINDCLRKHLRPCDGWLSIMADDHEFEADILFRLLSHNVDVVAPLVCLRAPPNFYSAFHATPEGGFRCMHFDEFYGKTGLVPVDSFGGPMSVIRRRVLDAVGMPFFEGQAGEMPREDLVSFYKMKKMGFQPYIDTDMWISHLGPGSATPTRNAEGRYGVSYRFQGQTVGDVYYLPPDIDLTVPAGYHAST